MNKTLYKEEEGPFTETPAFWLWSLLESLYE